MKDKCKKYEALFTFANDETFREHVASCPDCQKEQEVMDNVSSLLREVRPYYIKERKEFARFKMACAVFAILFCGTTLGIVNFNTDVSDIIKYGTTLSAEDLGLPVDSYGFVMVD